MPAYARAQGTQGRGTEGTATRQAKGCATIYTRPRATQPLAPRGWWLQLPAVPILSPPLPIWAGGRIAPQTQAGWLAVKPLEVKPLVKQLKVP